MQERFGLGERGDGGDSAVALDGERADRVSEREQLLQLCRGIRLAQAAAAQDLIQHCAHECVSGAGGIGDLDGEARHKGHPAAAEGIAPAGAAGHKEELQIGMLRKKPVAERVDLAVAAEEGTFLVGELRHVAEVQALADILPGRLLVAPEVAAEVRVVGDGEAVLPRVARGKEEPK